MKESTRVLAALAAAIGGGALVAASGSKPLIDAADALAPVGTLWVNAIRMTVIPLVVSLLITGVVSAADLGAIGRIGGRTLVVFGLLLAAIAAIVVPLASALFALLPLPSTAGAKPTLPAGAVEAANQLSATGQNPSFSAWLTSLIPSNPIAAAASGAMVPLILFTLILAIAIARSPESTRTPLVGLARALGDVMLLIVRWVVLAAPVGVFALVLPIAAHLGGAVAGAIGVYIAAYSLACVAVILLIYPVVAVFGGVGIGRFARAALPAQLIAFSSSSSIASLPALIEDSRSRVASLASCCRSPCRRSRWRRQYRGRSARCSSAGSTAFRCTHASSRRLPLPPSFWRSRRRACRAARSSCSRHCSSRSGCPRKELVS